MDLLIRIVWVCAVLFSTADAQNTFRQQGRELSFQQQNQILSDIQQHQQQHRLHQNAHVQFPPNQQQAPQFNSVQRSFLPPAQQNFFPSQPVVNQRLQNPQQPPVYTQQQLLNQQRSQQQIFNPQNNFNQPPFVNQINNNNNQPRLVNNFQRNQPLVAQQSIVNNVQRPIQNNLQQPQFIQPAANPQFVQQNVPQTVPQTIPQTDQVTLEKRRQIELYLEEQRQIQRLKELKEQKDKQQIVQKHRQFVEKQYEKGLKKAQQEHEAFLEKQRLERQRLVDNFYKSQPSQSVLSQNKQKKTVTEEAHRFEEALRQYYVKNPTTTTTTTTTTTEKPKPKPTKAGKSIFRSETDDPELFLQGSRQQLYTELKKALENENKSFRPTALPDRKKNRSELSSVSATSRDDLLKQLKLAIAENPIESTGNDSYASREITLPNGEVVEVVRTSDPKLIANGSPFPTEVKQKTSIKPTTITPPQILLEDLTKSIIPSGADFELIKQTKNGIEKIDEIPTNIPGGKKVTFVLLEEQNDGSYKVQGVRGNTKDAKNSVDVDSILEKIKNGEIKLPPSEKVKPSSASASVTTATRSPVTETSRTTYHSTSTSYVTTPAAVFQSTRTNPHQTSSTFNFNRISSTTPPSFRFENHQYEERNSSSLDTQPLFESTFQNTVVNPNVQSTEVDYRFNNNPTVEVSNPGTQTARPSIELTPPFEDRVTKPTRNPTFSTVTSNFPDFSTLNFFPISSTVEPSVTPTRFTEDDVMLDVNQFDLQSRSPKVVNNAYSETTKETEYNENKVSSTVAPIQQFNPSSSAGQMYYQQDNNQDQDHVRTSSTIDAMIRNVPFAHTELIKETTTNSLPVTTEPSINSNEYNFPSTTLSEIDGLDIGASKVSLVEIFKNQGLHAMAKYLRQSGLDTILNETGPYTIFAPTDKAFKSLLIQLGGPERAEEKFKENPRLLSGLLLHHVIPGAFEIATLQDEMTGVSLAGTQLRVNQYNMHDDEWNEVTITTINGARVDDNRRDLVVPQGIAHAVERVMFPLPVGDLLQTLQADRERRFATTLRALHVAGLADTLQGTQTYTLFAPTEKAWASLGAEAAAKLTTERGPASAMLSRHIAPGTLYTAGMRYYQIRDSLDSDTQLTIAKNGGKVKVNNTLIVTQNIPATNGVIHVIDSLL